jgi:hypothetical protein
MKHIYISLSLVYLSICCAAQPTITSANLPQPGQAVVTRNATLLTDVDLTFTGSNVTWSFGEDVIEPGNNLTTLNCIPVESTPLAYQFLFNNPFDEEHNSDFAQGVDNLNAGQITLEDAYAYFQNNSNRYAQVGLGATINSIPVPAQGNPVDVIYEFPLEFMDQSSYVSAIQFSLPTLGFWRSDQTRTNFVDGWGTLQIYGLSLPVIRCVTTIDAIDSIYIDFLQTGTLFPRPQAVEYKWLSPQYNVPVLQITTTAGAITAVATPDFFASIPESLFGNIQIFPNPTTNVLNIQGIRCMGQLYTVTDNTGRIVHQGNLYLPNIDLAHLPSGHYILHVAGTSTRAFIKQ